LTEEGTEAMINTASIEHNQTRQSQRVKEQGLQGIKIAEKTVLAAQKKNLEGNHTNFKNSFAVLNNSDLADRAGKMGVNTNNVELEKIDILRESEHARNNLVGKLNHVEGTQNLKGLNNLPLEEMKFIEWRSDSSEEENFQVVKSRISKKRERKLKNQSNTSPKGIDGHPYDGSSTFDGGEFRASSKYNLRRGVAGKNFDRSNLEL
jgi:hypothetical protein